MYARFFLTSGLQRLHAASRHSYSGARYIQISRVSLSNKRHVSAPLFFTTNTTRLYSKNVNETFQDDSAKEESADGSEKPPSKGVKGKLALTFAILGTFGLLYFGRPFPDETKLNNQQISDIFQAYLRRIKERYGTFVKKFADPSSPSLLPTPTPGTPQPPYTLVIDLDETLVHSVWSRNHGWRVARRPGADFFLSYLSQFYEIVVISSQHVTYADPVITKLDPYGFVSYRLYRDGTKYVKGIHKKDLSHLNRDLKKVILIDDNQKESDLQKENVILVNRWDANDPRDRELFDLIPFLEALALSNVDDVRTMLKSHDGKVIAKEFREKNEENLRKMKLDADRKRKGLFSKIAPLDSVSDSLSFDQVQEKKYKQFLVHKELMIKKMENHMKELKEKEEKQSVQK